MTTAASGASRKRSHAKPQRGQTIVLTLICVILIAALVWLWLSAPQSQSLLFTCAAILGLVGVYPFTYIAYRGFGARAQRKRLEDDFRLLGLAREEELEETVENLYQTVYSSVQFWVYISLIVIVSILVLSGYLYRKSLGFISEETMTVVFFGYAGAYIFAIQELIRRYNTFDLQPQVYSSILVRMLMAIIVTFVGASVISLNGSNVAGDATEPAAPQAWSAILAFVIGIFPTRGLRWFTQQTNRILTTPALPSAELPLRDLLGIGTWHEARLVEMGIDDAQNLATVDIRRLLLTTQFDTQEIIHWIDQAMLYAKVGSKIDRFRDAKIVTFHQFRLVLAALTLKPLTDLSTEERNERIETRKRLALALGMLDDDEMLRVADNAGFPNYAHIAEYYVRTAIVARQRANIGMEIVIGAIRETDFARAVEDGERLLTQNPDDPKLLNNLGYAYYRLGKLEQALSAYTESIRLNSRMAEAYYNRSLIFTDKRLYEKAVRDCTDALNINHTNPEALNNRGLAYMKMGYLDRAIEDLDEALRIDDRLAAAYLNRGVGYNAQSKFMQAAKDFERAYLLNNRVPELWLAWGIALIGLENFHDAVDKLSQAVLYESDSAKAYTTRGFAYLQLGREYYSQARVDLETAVNRDKNMTDAHNNLGLLEARLGNFESAITHYQIALNVSQAQFVTWYNLARAYSQLGKRDAMSEAFQKVIIYAPKDSYEAEQARLELASGKMNENTGG